MPQSSADRRPEESSKRRLTDLVRESRDRVLEAGIPRYWLSKWFIATVVLLVALAVGVVLVARSAISFDTLLNYFALGLLLFVFITLFYGIIAIHDVPYEIAKHRNHPHQDAIHAAGWVSLFTLHALWPFLWIWAMLYRPERGWGVHDPSSATESEAIKRLHDRVAELEQRMNQGEKKWSSY